MKKIAVTQRVEVSPAYGERRDCLDQRWTQLLTSCGFHPVLFPNNPEAAASMWGASDVVGLLMTGGNSLCEYGGDAPERDETESFLLDAALRESVPVLGVCRGMQIIQHRFGDVLNPVDNHVDTRHRLRVSDESAYSTLLNKIGTVNAYHNLGAFESSGILRVAARAEDNVIMAVEHPSKPVFGQMWHTERDTPFPLEQLALFQSVLG